MKKLIVCLSLAAFALGSTVQAGEECAKAAAKAKAACTEAAKAACADKAKAKTAKASCNAAKASACAKKAARAHAFVKGATKLVQL